MFAILWIFLGVAFVGVAIGNMLEYFADLFSSKFDKGEHMDSGFWGGGAPAGASQIADDEPGPLVRMEASRGFNVSKRDLMSNIKSQSRDRISQLYQGLAWHLLGLLSVLAIGSVGMVWLEGWTVVDAMYFTVVTATTVGFGDKVPTFCGSKIFTVIFILCCFFFVAHAVAYFASLPLELHRVRKQHEVLTQFGVNLHKEELDGMLNSEFLKFVRHGDPAREHSKEVSKAEFMLWLLVKQGKLDRDDVQDVVWAFHVLDKRDDFKLTEKDIQDIDLGDISQHVGPRLTRRSSWN